MKKLFALVITVIMLMSFSVCAAGTENVGTISITGIDAAKDNGDTFTVGVNISDNPNIGAIIFDIEYDKERLEFLGAEDSGLKGWVVNTSAVWVNAKGSKQTGEILKLKFKVKDTSPDGFAYISVANVDCATVDEKLVGYTVSSSGVSIGKECTHEHKTKHTGKMSTCIEHGINDYYTCDDCKAVLKSDGKTVTTLENETLPLIDHSLGKLVNEVPASCVAEGMKAYYTCSVCGVYFDEDKDPIAYKDLVVLKTPHQMGEKWYADGNEHWHECVFCGQKMMSEKHTLSGGEANCIESIYCSVCGYIITPKTGHTDENGDKICDICGASWQELPEISAAQSTLSYKKGTDGNISVFVKNLGENDLRFIKLNDSTLSMNDYDVTATKDGAMITIKGEALDELSSGNVNIFISTVFGDLEAKGTIERADKPESSADIVIPKKDSAKDDGKKSPALIIAAAAVVAAVGVFVLIKKKKSDN